MDSHFINFDGRSVHDMIELLLATSGDPEAIARLQQAIQAVDAKFGPVDTELARLEEDKQDSGNYITDNVENTVANISKAMIANVDSGYDIQINNTGTGNVDVDWLRFIFKGSADKQIAATIRRNGTWETAARWTADADTGFKEATVVPPFDSTNTQVLYRRKNGIILVYISIVDVNASLLTLGTLNTICTLPEGFRPNVMNHDFGFIDSALQRIWFGRFAINGDVRINVPAGTTGNINSRTSVIAMI